MTDSIQIPQRTPPAPPPLAVPEGVIQDYLNYNRNLPFKMSEQIQQGLNSLVDYQLKKQQLGLERTKTVGDVVKDYAAARANFGEDADSLYRPILQSVGYPTPSQTGGPALPSTTTVPPQRIVDPSASGGVPSNAPAGAQDSAQTLASTPQVANSVIADTMSKNPDHAITLGIQNHEVQDYISDPIGFMKKRGKVAADRAQQGLTALHTQQEMNANQPFSQEQSGVVNDLNSTPADLARVFPSGIPQRAQEAFNTTRNYGAEANRFQQTRKQELNSKQEQIEKEFQEKNIAIKNAINAVTTSLDLKRNAASGPLTGGLASIASDVTHGAVASPTYLLNQHNALAAPLLQHSQDVNRFNPIEVTALKGGGLSLPGEPMDVSQKKAHQVLSIYQQRLAQNEQEKAAKLAALGIPYKPQLAPVSNQPEQNTGGTGPAPRAGFVRIQASNGSLHDLPKQNLAKAQLRDPGLKVVSQNGN